MGLRNIVGHEKPLDRLRGYIMRARIPHAFLFAGEEGVGKRLTAVNFAKALNCQKNLELFSETTPRTTHNDPDSCDECPSCVKVDKSAHPDIFLIGPEGDGRQITVSSVRSLQESLAYRPFEGLWKIAVIDDAETMNKSAANAFLETLEEPPQQSILIMVSSRPDTLLSTIRSRCHRINFSPLPLSEMGELLQEKIGGLDHDGSLLLGALSGGRFGYAMNEDLLNRRDKSFSEFREMLCSPDKDVWADRESMDEWFDWSQLWLREIAVLKATGKKELLINQDKESDIMDVSGKAGLRDILRLASELNRIKGELKFNLNKQLTLNYTGILLRNALGNSG